MFILFVFVIYISIYIKSFYSFNIKMMILKSSQITLFSATFSFNLWKFVIHFVLNANQIS